MTNKQAFAKAEVRRRYDAGELRGPGEALAAFHEYLKKSKDELPRRGMAAETWEALKELKPQSKLFYWHPKRVPYRKPA